jgi:hypothetical protein
MILLLVLHNGEREKICHYIASYIVDSGGDHFGLEKSATRVNSQKVLDFTVADGLCGGK